MAEPSPAAAPLYRLRVRQPETAEQEVYPEVTPFVVGREDDCDLVLTDVQISRHHFQLEIQPDGRVVVRDLGSANGTFIDTGRVTDGAWLPLPGMISVGRSSIVVETVKRGAAPTVIAPRPDLGGPDESGVEEPSDPARLSGALAAALVPDVSAAVAQPVDSPTEPPVDPTPAPLAPEVVAAAADSLPGDADPSPARPWGQPADPPPWQRPDEPEPLPPAPVVAALGSAPAPGAPVAVAAAAAPIPPPAMPTPATPIAPPATPAAGGVAAPVAAAAMAPSSGLDNPATAPQPTDDPAISKALRIATRALLTSGLLLIIFGALQVLGGFALSNRGDEEIGSALQIGGAINLVLGIAEVALSRLIRRPGRTMWYGAVVVSGIVIAISAYAEIVSLGAGLGLNLGFFVNLLLIMLGIGVIVNLMRTKTWHQQGAAA